MPVSLIKEAVLNNLNSLGYQKIDIEENPIPLGGVKGILLSGDGCNVTVVSENEFIVSVSENAYFKALAIDFWFSFQKVEEQSKFFDAAKLNLIPPAWLLVSVYYSAYYSAIELGRLNGCYNLYLKDEHCNSINSHATGSTSLRKGNYIGSVTSDSGYIEIRFTARVKSQPHDLAWKNVLKILNYHNISNVPLRKEKNYKLIKSIVDSGCNFVHTPNNVRNNWNYSFANAYDPKFSGDIGQIKDYLNPKSSLSILNWPNHFQQKSQKQNDVFSVVYVERILHQCMQDLNARILA